MPIISVRDNESNSWKRNAKKKQQQQQQQKEANKQRQKREKGIEPIVKEWEINDFLVHLS